MILESVSPRRRKTGREDSIQAADSMSAAFCMFQTMEEILPSVRNYMFLEAKWKFAEE
jgi:hypothetical protein